MEKTGESASAEVRLLRKLCRSLDGQRQKSRKEAVEWQNFGRYTATVLQKEVAGFERKLRVLQEKLDQLVHENAELREMCLYLDKSREGSGGGGEGGKSGHSKLQGSASSKSRAPVHSMCAAEMNKDEGPTPQYAGITSQNTLHDKRRKKFNLLGIKGMTCRHTYCKLPRPYQCIIIDPQKAAAELQKRVEKLESEKLELVKVCTYYFDGLLSRFFRSDNNRSLC